MAFIHEDYLLTSPAAKKIYHSLMGELPVVDYHNHLEAKEILEDLPYENLSQIWLSTDHYKWRLMRANGIDEAFITGDKTDYEKFYAFASTLPYAIGNPVYHWAQLELKRYFDIDELLNETTAEQIWNKANAVIKEKALSPRKLIEMSNVELLCTTNDPLENLEYHLQLADGYQPCKVVPTFRPDRAITVNSTGYLDYLKQLSEISGLQIINLDTLVEALGKRIDFFASAGCVISDHSLENYEFVELDEETLSAAFKRILKGEKLNLSEANGLTTYLMQKLSLFYKAKGWIVQLHVGAIRNNNTELLGKLGVNCGVDSVDDLPAAQTMNQLLNHLATNKTIVYHLNDATLISMATMIANFQSSEVPGQYQLGPAWWFNDHKSGIEKMLNVLASQGLIGRFVGMLTDSRSFLSFSRHEYFRRILSNLLGKWVEEGFIPNDDALLEKVSKDIAYYNIINYIKS